MNYAVTSYHKKYMPLYRQCSQNLGDWVQMIAAESLLKEWGIENPEYISRNTLKNYAGPEAKLLLNGIYTPASLESFRIDTFPIPNTVSPVIMSWNCTDDYLPDETWQQLLRHAPIGCRDEETYLKMRAKGIPAYISGCVTALLPRRKATDKQNKIILMDISKKAEQYIPAHLLNNAVRMNPRYPLTRTEGDHYTTEEESRDQIQKTREMLDYFRDNAGLVVTSRLHTASPCMAMGIPVILMRFDFDERFSWIEKYLPLYNEENWDKIDWSPKPVDYEDDKAMLKKILKHHFFGQYTVEELNCATDYYKDRQPYAYNYNIHKALQAFQPLKPQNYCIWGLSQKTRFIHNCIVKDLKGWQLKKAVANRGSGQFWGVKVDQPDQIDLDDKDLVYIVTSPALFDEARERLKGNKYILADEEKTEWESNLT